MERNLFDAIGSGFEDDLVKHRVLYLLQWYTKRAEFYKKQTYVATLLSLVIPASITLLNSGALLSSEMAQIPTLVLSFCSTIGTGLYAFLRSKDHWLRYRLVAEALKRESILYLAKQKEAPSEAGKIEFLERIEAICTSEIAEWHSLRSSHLESKEDLTEKNPDIDS